MKMKLIENPDINKLSEFVFKNKYLCICPKNGNGAYNLFYFSNTETRDINEIILDNYKVNKNPKLLEKSTLIKYGSRWPLPGVTLSQYYFYEINPFNNKIIEFLKHV